MAKEYPRSRRVAEQILRELSVVIQQELKDPRLGPVTVTDVDVSPDLSHAKVYVSFLTAEDHDERLEILRGAGGFLRRELGRRVVMKRLPELRFIYDESFDRADRIERLIADAVSRDERGRS